MMVLWDLQNTIDLRQGNKAYTRASATAKYTVNQTQNLIEEVIHAAEEIFQSCQDLSTMAMWNLLSKVATIILRNWKTVQPGEPT